MLSVRAGNVPETLLRKQVGGKSQGRFPANLLLSTLLIGAVRRTCAIYEPSKWPSLPEISRCSVVRAFDRCMYGTSMIGSILSGTQNVSLGPRS